MTTYRLDKVKKLLNPSEYKVPCGMNSILWMNNFPPHRPSLLRSNPISEGYVGILSKYDNNLRDYKVIAILGDSNHA